MTTKQPQQPPDNLPIKPKNVPPPPPPKSYPKMNKNYIQSLLDIAVEQRKKIRELEAETNYLRKLAIDWLKGEEAHWMSLGKDVDTVPDYEDLVKKTRALVNE